MIAYLNKTIPLPNIQKGMDTTPVVLGDGGETIDGTSRWDWVAWKEQWKMDLSNLTWEEYQAIIGHLRAQMGRATWFWLDEMGGTPSTNSVMAYVKITKDQRTPFGDSKGWHDKGRSLSLEIKRQG